MGEKKLREQLKRDGYRKSRITQLIKATMPEHVKRGGTPKKASKQKNVLKKPATVRTKYDSSTKGSEDDSSDIAESPDNTSEEVSDSSSENEAAPAGKGTGSKKGSRLVKQLTVTCSILSLQKSDSCKRRKRN